MPFTVIDNNTPVGFNHHSVRHVIKHELQLRAYYCVIGKLLKVNLDLISYEVLVVNNNGMFSRVR